MNPKKFFLVLVVVVVVVLTGCKNNPLNPLDEKGDSAQKTPTGSAQATVQATPSVSGNPKIELCTFDKPGNIDDMSKTVIEQAQQDLWFHRVYNPKLFNAANNWGGADSWFVSLALGANTGGSWISHGNPGQIIFRATSVTTTWCLGVSTSGQYKQQFLAGANDSPVAINVRIAPNALVSVRTNSGKIVSQTTSDTGDITIILPDDGVVVIAVAFTTAAPTFESLIWWGPYDRSADINTIDARE